MMENPFLDQWQRLRSYVGRFRGRKSLNFITLHYLYMLGMTLLGSIILVPGGGLYIDALFFAAGSVTQSGLNPVDLNALELYQQIIIYFLAMLTNPIIINTFVVIVRLYWFEKRFQNVVKEAMAWRSSRSRGRADAEDVDVSGDGEERGVNGRSIVVIHGSGKSLGPGMDAKQKEKSQGHDVAASSSSSGPQKRSSSNSSERSQLGPLPGEGHQPAPLHRNITFADEVRLPLERSGDMPASHMSAEQHIAFLENQRNPIDKGALRIPGPRESDQGQNPETVGEEKVDGLEERSGRRFSVDDPSSRPDLHKLPSHVLNRMWSRRTNTTNAKNPVDRDESLQPSRRSGTFLSLRNTKTSERDQTPYLSWQPTIGRNSAFIDLTDKQREELGGIEYRSLKTLLIILGAYFVGFHAIGIICFLPWIFTTDPWRSVVEGDSVNLVWWGFFSPATLFNDLGFTLTPDSFLSFQGAVMPLLLGSFLIVIGNTGFPCMLRLLIWVLSKFVPTYAALFEELKFLLDHPRRCFTLLFPAAATWLLFAILVLLNGIDLIFFIILDLNDDAVTSINPPGLRVLNGLFQATSTRTSGTAVVNLAALHPGIQVSYLIMMYISVFPIAISVRRTNVYEEKSLGIYGSQQEEEEDEREPSYIGAHLRKQLSFDLWFIFLGLFIVAIAEGGRISDDNDPAFSLFSCLFEIVSAYGTVGLSLGYPNTNASLSAQFSTVSKLVIIAMMIRGRHRGLPYELDRAILLPSEGLHRKEDADAARRRNRRNSNATGAESIRQASIVGMGVSTGVSRDDEREHAIVTSPASMQRETEPGSSYHSNQLLFRPRSSAGASTP